MGMPRVLLSDGLWVLARRYQRAGKHDGEDVRTLRDLQMRIDAPQALEADIVLCHQLLGKHEITEAIVHAVICRAYFDEGATPEVKSYCQKQGVVPPPFPTEIESISDRKSTEAATKLLTDKAWWEKQLRMLRR